MFGFLKNLIGDRRAAPASTESDSPDTAPAGSAASTAASKAPPSPSTTRTPADPTPAKAATSGSTKSGPLSRPGAGGSSGRVLLCLRAITEKFPAPLMATLAAPPDAGTQVSLKLDELLPQLSSGRVEITLADLRRIAPVGTFVDDTSRDGEKVVIPLNELLPKIDSTLLQPRSQQRIEVPQDIETPFRKQESSGTTTRMIPVEDEKADEKSEEPVAPEPEPSEPPQERSKLAPGIEAPSEIQALFKKKEPTADLPATPPPAAPAAAETSAAVQPIRLTPPPPEKSEPPKPPEPLETEPAPIKLSISPEPSTPPPAKPTAPAATGPGLAGRRMPMVDAPAPRPSAPPPPPEEPKTISLMPEAPAPTAPAVSPTAPAVLPTKAAAPAPNDQAAPRGPIAIPLSAVSKAWPEAIREETAGADADAVINFPRAELETALKMGKVALQWARLRSWVCPSLPGGGGMYDDAVVELPLPIVAPLFMAAAAPAQAARKVTVDESMPALFQPAKATPPAPATPSSPAAGAASPSAPAATTGAGAAGVDGRMPSLLVERACTLRGVAGAVVALPDGLLVSASVPEEFSAETIAAFLPQVFSKLEQAAGSMKIGAVAHLSFTAGERAWQIWRAGDLFFAAIGVPHEMLPGAQLKIIAGQLARQTQG